MPSLASTSCAAACSAAFFDCPCPTPTCSPSTVAAQRERAVVRRALDVQHRVAHRAASPGKRLLKLGLEVDVAGQRVVDPAREGLDDRRVRSSGTRARGRARPAKLRAARRARCGSSSSRLSSSSGIRSLAPLEQPRPQVELPRHDGAARPRDDVRADLRQPALGEVGVVVVERARDRELEHAVAEELEPLVRGRTIGRPGRVREDVLEPLLGQPVDQAVERAARYWCEET